ncbi:hypothetical protein DSL72_004403 [Monilinia vaccinii-corymbosi]|uniref:Amidoligase enzyme n=1 Tax=Monilinia vaccinii-corymbosi TaxID=61207 RepID=A0A8A3NVZ5_9HELO|nr:hypothetical protein DSL72_004403 [Monilinia vaccinii-corymbosi]
MTIVSPDTPSFGIEFEFLIAVLDNPRIANPHPRDPRTVYFPPTPHDAAPPYYIIPAGKEDWANEWSIYAHIKRTLSSIGLPTEPGQTARSKFATWDVTTDISIQPPRAPSPKFTKAHADWKTYTYIPIEVRTPAYYYSEDALRDVRDFCRVMRRTYLTTLNESCGLHVHVGYGTAGFALPHLRRFATLLHAFEPQLESLHPDHRIDDRNVHCSSVRRATYGQWRFRQEHGREARVLESMAALMRCATRDGFREALGSEGAAGAFSYVAGTGAWNFERMGTETRERLGGVPDTIECRQHEGSLDPDEVVNWVRTVVGLVVYTRDPDALAFRALLGRVRGEMWVKRCPSVREVGVGRYLPRATLYRPVFGQEWCGLVGLLRVLGLEAPAAFYEKRRGRGLVEGVYRHWYTSAPVECLIAGEERGDEDDGHGDEGKDDKSSSFDPCNFSHAKFEPSNPNPETPSKKPGEKKEEEEKKPEAKEKPTEKKYAPVDLRRLGIDSEFSESSSAEEKKKVKGKGNGKAEEKQAAASEKDSRETQASEKQDPNSSSEEEFPMRPDAATVQAAVSKAEDEGRDSESCSSSSFKVALEYEGGAASEVEFLRREGEEARRGGMVRDLGGASVGGGVNEGSEKDEEANLYLPPLRHASLLPLTGPSDYNERNPIQHSHLLNGTTPADIEALAPNTQNYRGNLLHRRDRAASHPWLTKAPNNGMNPNRAPYPGPTAWMGWEYDPDAHPDAPMQQSRAQLADALAGRMGETWEIQHEVAADREAGMRRMMAGLRLADVSPSIERLLLARHEDLGRIDRECVHALFPGPARTAREFETQDDYWWRFEIAGATLEQLEARALDDADPEAARDAMDMLVRIGGEDGASEEYWPEGAANPFGGAERIQQPVWEDISPGADDAANVG